MSEKISELSDDAFRLWLAVFPLRGSTLSFGGDHAEYRITDRARAALNELLSVEAVEVSEPFDSWPNREHYKSGEANLYPEAAQNRPHLNPLKDTEHFVIFTKKGKA